MEKLLAEEQVKLVQSGDTAKILAYIERYRLCNGAQIKLIELNDEALFGAYVQKGRLLSNKAAMKLIALKNTKLIALYIDKWSFDSKMVEDAFLELKDMELIERYIKRHYLFSLNEVLLVRLGDVDLIKEYICRWDFTWSDSVVETIKLHDAELIGLLLSKRGRLYDEAEVELMKFGNAALIEAYFKRTAFIVVCAKAQEEFIKLNNKELIKKCDLDALSEGAVVELIRLHDAELWELYFKKRVCGFGKKVWAELHKPENEDLAEAYRKWIEKPFVP